MLDQLDSNPLPGVLVLSPTADNSSPEKIEALRDQLNALPQADLVKLDMEWLQRLNRITDISRRLTLALAAMLAAGVLLIVVCFNCWTDFCIHHRMLPSTRLTFGMPTTSSVC